MTIQNNIQTIKKRIAEAEKQSHRPSGSVQLLGVSKGQSAQAIQDAFAGGIEAFGENYWQEAQLKINALQHLPITWHFIGPIQSNKAALIAQTFAWVHSVCREKIARLLSASRSVTQSPLNVCIQVNLDGEPTKAGITPEQLLPLAETILALPNIKLRGLMAIPEPKVTFEEQYENFLRLHALFSTLNKQFKLNLDTLSMGMSDDLTAAIHAGSTIVRVGRAIFGERLP